jgi:hypothetical protein
MIDYYSLIVKAVTNLQNRQARRAVYERGRNALMVELKAVTPSLSQSIITKEMLAFETAIGKAEAEMARRAAEAE